MWNERVFSNNAGNDKSGLFATYDNVLRDIADRLAPAHTIYSRVQLLAPWFDSECREIRHDCQRLETIPTVQV